MFEIGKQNAQNIVNVGEQKDDPLGVIDRLRKNLELADEALGVQTRENLRLEKIISDTKSALEPLAEAADYYDDHFPDDVAIVVYRSSHTINDSGSKRITIGDARRARDVLKHTETTIECGCELTRLTAERDRYKEGLEQIRKLTNDDHSANRFINETALVYLVGEKGEGENES